MLRTDLVPSRHLRNNRSRAIRRRDNPALLFLGPATPAANTSPDFNTPKRPPRIVKYIVDHICEPISPNRSTSDELSAPPQGAVKTPLSIEGLPVQQDRARDGLQTARSRAEKLAPSRRHQPVAKTRSRCDIQRRDRGHRQADRPSAHNRRRLTGPGRHQNLAIAPMTVRKNCPGVAS